MDPMGFGAKKVYNHSSVKVMPRYVVTTGADCTEAQLKKLEKMKFSRGGLISVIRIPDQPWCRESSQDVHPRETGMDLGSMSFLIINFVDLADLQCI